MTQNLLTINDAELEQDEEETPFTQEQYRRRSELQCNYMKILEEEEELYWYKRSHETWFLEGDKFTEYFHRIANRKKRKNTIFSLQDKNCLVEGDKDLISLATRYYKDLFGPAVNHSIPLNPDL
jgi:hypothetical protein